MTLNEFMKENHEIKLSLIIELLEQDSGAYTIFINDKFYTFVYDRNECITDCNAIRKGLIRKNANEHIRPFI
jgi:hypothetical protein